MEISKSAFLKEIAARSLAMTLTFVIMQLNGFAQTKVLPLDSAVNMGIAHSNKVKMSGSKVNEAKSSYLDIKNRIMPDFSAAVGYDRLSNIPVEYFTFPGLGTIPSTSLFPIILNNYSLGASISESVFNGFQYKYAVQNYDVLEKSTEFSLESEKKNVAISIVNLYISLFKLQRAHVLILENLDEIAAHVKEVSDFAGHGLATQNDVLRTQLQQSNTQLTEIDIKNQIESTNFNLDVMLGLPETTQITVDSNSILDGQTIQPLPYYLENYAQNRNDMKSADLQEKAAEVAVTESKSGVYPKLSVGADYNYLRPNPRLVPPIDEFQPSWDIGFRISYSITSLYENKDKTDVNRAKVEEAKANYDQLSDDSRMEINKDYFAYKESLEKIDVAKKSLAQAQENYRIVKSRYDNHIALLTDLLDADDFLLNAKINLISAKADATQAYYSLQKAAGEFNIK